MSERRVEDLRNKYKGEEIWVLGCGPSLDEYPDDFFDNKISVACNLSMLAFPNCTYFVNYHTWTTDFIRKYLLKYSPEFADKWILWFQPEDKKWNEWVPQFNPIIMDRYRKGCTEEKFNEAVKAIMDGKPCKYVDNTTIAHVGIQVAAILGARKITLVGCEHKAIAGKRHAQKRGMWIFYKDKETLEPYPRTAKVGRMMRLGTFWFAEAFKRYGIEVMRYSFNEGYEEIVCLA